ncbi:phosphoribosylamine--glycine ligase, partial [bacterium]|nr:phosphoribosylamine--glycine ligase [bacterium]
EFSLMSFSDGEHLVHMPCAQDNKRALAGDTGPNTGGMGSYSFSDGSMPFISDKELKDGQEINLKVMKALKEKTGKPYRGILYGNFIATKKGLKIIEYNARLGDPEAMNVLSVFKSDFVEVCLGIIEGNLNEKKVEFENKATVCKYAVPQGYPEDPIKDETINVDSIDTSKVDIYYAAVDKREDGIYLTGSRAVAIVAKHEDIYEAERLAEEEINNIIGPVIHREDIGKKKLIEKRIEMMNKLKE